MERSERPLTIFWQRQWQTFGGVWLRQRDTWNPLSSLLVFAECVDQLRNYFVQVAD